VSAPRCLQPVVHFKELLANCEGEGYVGSTYQYGHRGRMLELITSSRLPWSGTAQLANNRQHPRLLAANRTRNRT
jgi:hypothetical protein